MLTLAKLALNPIELPMRGGLEAIIRPEEMVERPVRLPVLAAQKRFILSDDYLSAMVGGIGAGKTVGLTSWIPKKMYDEREGWQNGCRGTLGGIFANTYKQLSQSTLPELWLTFDRLGFVYGRDYVYNEAPPASWRFKSAFKKDHGSVLTVRWWGQCVVRSLDNAESVRGMTLGWAAIDEARGAKRSAFDIVFGRLRCPRALRRQLKMVTSPNGFDWIYELLVEKPPPVSTSFVQVRTSDNPYFPRESLEALRGTYDALYAEQELEGKFVSLTRGAVYRCFDRMVNLDPNRVPGGFKPEPDADFYVSFDFNRTPFCAVIAQVRGRYLVVLEEVRLEDADTQRMCDEICHTVLPGLMGKARAVRVYGDPAGRQRTTKSNWSDYDVITREFTAAFGARFVPSWAYSHPGVIESVNAVNGMLKNSKGEPYLFVHPKCRHLIKDLERVVFKPGTRDINKTGEENKMLTHVSDALRYLVSELFPVASRSVSMVTI